MQPSEKLCRFCAENIETAAIRCKHCQADLRPRGKRLLIRLSVSAAIVLAAYLVLSDTDDKAEVDAMADVAVCQDQASSVASPLARSIIDKACRQIEDDVRKHLSRAP